MPVIRYRLQPNIQLKLYLPLLDYIHIRSKGELGGELARIHWAQLDTFRAELLEAKNILSNEEEIALLIVGVDGKIDLRHYIMDGKNNVLEIV